MLEHNDFLVVYNSVGCLINLSNSELFYFDKIFEKCLEGISKIQIFNLDLLFVVCQLVSNILNFGRNCQNVEFSRIGIQICEEFLKKGEGFVGFSEGEGVKEEEIKGKKIEQILARSKAIVENLKIGNNL